MLRYLLALSALLLLLAACGPAEVPPEESGTPAAATAVVGDTGSTDTGTVDAGPPPDFAGADYETTASGLQVAILEEGDGEQAQPGDVVRVHYRGLLGDGTVFDSSEGRDAFRFPLGQGAVISGWDEGIGLLNEGGRALLVIPPDLGYGASGSGGVIPPNATLYFEVELVEVLEGGPDEPVNVSESDYETTESGLQYYVVEEGDGDMPEDGQPVRVHFTYWLDDGTRLESSLDAGEPFLMTIGSEQLPDGLNEALAMMRVGEQTQFIIPPDLAFGEQDLGSIPPNSTLIFLMQLVELLAPPPAEPFDLDEGEYETNEAGFQIADIEEGSGEPVTAGDTVAFHVTGWLADDGTRIFSSYEQGEPIQLPIGSGQALPGWDEGLDGMRIGGVRQVVVPPELGFGEAGAGTIVPPNATLIWLLELVSTTAVPQ
jgi:peptidylprolyl isomerase